MSVDRSKIQNLKDFIAFYETKKELEEELTDPIFVDRDRNPRLMVGILNFVNKVFKFSFHDNRCAYYRHLSSNFNIHLDEEDLEYLYGKYTVMLEDLQCQADNEDLEGFIKRKEELERKIESIKPCD